MKVDPLYGTLQHHWTYKCHAD